MSENDNSSPRSVGTSSESVNLSVYTSCLSEDLHFVTPTSSFVSAISTMENIQPEDAPATTSQSAITDGSTGTPTLQSETVLTAKVETSNVLSETSLAAEFETPTAQTSMLLTAQPNMLSSQSQTVLTADLETSNVISERCLASEFETRLTIGSDTAMVDPTEVTSATKTDKTEQSESMLKNKLAKVLSSQSHISRSQTLRTEMSVSSVNETKALLSAASFSGALIEPEEIYASSEASSTAEFKDPEALQCKLLDSEEKTMSGPSKSLLAAKSTDLKILNPSLSDASFSVGSTNSSKDLLTAAPSDLKTSKASLSVKSKSSHAESETTLNSQSQILQNSPSKTSTGQSQTSLTHQLEIPWTTESNRSVTSLSGTKPKSITASFSKQAFSDKQSKTSWYNLHHFPMHLTRKQIAMLMAMCGFLSCIITFTIALCIPEDPKMAALRAEQEYFEREVDLPIFKSAIRIEQIHGKAVVWHEAIKTQESNETSKIKEVILPTLQSSFEAEGFHISSVQALSLKPYSVAVYDVMNHTVTSLSYDPPSSPSSIGSDKSTEVKNLGLRNAVRLVFQCLATPSKNTAAMSVVGANEVGIVQFMLNNYLASQNIIAAMEPVEVPSEFKNAVRLARSAVPRLGRVNEDGQTQTGEFIACHKAGYQMSSSHQLVTCPSDCDEIMLQRQVIGTLWYHKDSPVCLAAIHANVIKASDGGNVEYIKSGFGFTFTGSYQHGINSTSLNQYGVRFIVKRPGPSWKASKAAEPTTEPKTTTEGIQETIHPLFQISFTLLKYGDTVTDYSSLHLGNPVLAARIKNTLKIKMRRALHNLHFDPRNMEVVFQLSLSVARSMFVKIKIYGGYNANAQGFFPYKPWKTIQLQKLLNDILKIFQTSSIKLKSSSLGVDKFLLSALEVIPSTTIAPTPYKGTCSCGEVFFIQSMDSTLTSTDTSKITSMYQKIFDAFDFDQAKLGLGIGFVSSSSKENADSLNSQISADGEIVTRIGQDLSTGAIRRIEEILKGFQANEVDVSEEKLWKMIQKLEKESSFMRENLGKRKKLLVVSSRFVFGPDAEINRQYLNRVKEKGIHVAYVGYKWDEDLLKSYYYPQQYASTPPTNFVKHVDNINQLDKVTVFLNQVISKYVCNKQPRTCTDLSFNIPPPSDLTYNLTIMHDDNFVGSYANGVPSGTGLKAFKVFKGLHYNGVQLARTSSIRKTEPDKRQAFYMSQQCGVPANQPSLQEGKIVGGAEALPHTWPWAISINKLTGSRDYYTNRMKYTKNFWLCGGSIVHKRWILTAAHCFAKGNELTPSTKYQVVVGRHDQNKFGTIPGDEYRIVKIAYHPKYDDPRNQYDIALLEVHRDIVFRREVSPVCLPNPDVIPRNDRRCWVVGWGFTSNTAKTPRNKLKQAVQYIESPNKCQYIYRRYYYNTNNNICAKRSKVKGNANIQCRGDSGGPLVCEENGRWVQYGVSNFGPRLCELGGEGAYFLVASVLDWMCCYLDKNVGPCAYVKCAYGTS